MLLSAALLCCVAAPKARASAVAISGGVVLTALVGYLATSGITYASSNVTTEGILDAIQDQLDDYFTQYYGGFENFVDEVRAINQPFSLGVNGGLALSPAAVALFEPIRQWLVTEVFGGVSATISVPLSSGSEIGWTVNGHQIGATDVFDLTAFDINPNKAGTLPGSVGGQYLAYITITDTMPFNVYCEGLTGHFNFSIETYPNNNFKYMEVGYYSASGTKVFYIDSFNTTMPTFIGLGWAIDREREKVAFCLYESDKFRDDPIVTHYTAARSFVEVGWELSDPLPGTMVTTYDDSVPVPTIPAGDVLTLDTVLPIVSPIEDLLAEILARIQAGEGTSEATTTPQAVTIPPPQYGPQSGYMLDLSGFFPFCIPRDLYLGLQLLDAEAEAPSFSWEMPLPDGSTYDLEIDLSRWDGVAAICRKCELFLFVVGLAVATRKFIKW